MRVTLLAGGYGGSKMAHGFALAGADLTVIGNVADDFELHGLHISPDLDTVMYALAGLASRQTGWGVSEETWSAAEMLARYGEPTWFRLGDRDLATHIVRTARLREGSRLTEVTDQLRRSLGVAAELLPATDDRVRTRLQTTDGWLDFQEWFVHRSHADEVLAVDFAGAQEAQPSVEAVRAIEQAELLVIGPSNPFVSIAPMLALPGLLAALMRSPAPVFAISPIVAGSALRGPAEAMLRSLAGEAGAAGVARHYARRYPKLIDAFVIDEQDRAAASEVEAAGLKARVTSTVMLDDAQRADLARALIAGAELGGSR